MKFREDADVAEFRAEVRSFLDTELPPELEGDLFDPIDDYFERAQIFQKKLVGRGWIGLHWPKEYGGMAASIMHQVAFNEELAYRRAPLVNRPAVNMLAPVLMLHGSEAQKKKYIKGIADSSAVWCQGYSEPEAGSDLASLKTRAVRDGDSYIINGQKIWTTHAHHADMIFMLVRTDPEAPKHRGISFLLADMKSPGIEVRPLVNMANQHEFNEVFFQDVVVPAENLVGEENRGWYIGAQLLDFERSNIATSAKNRRALDDLVALYRQVASPATRRRARSLFADRYIELEISRLISYKVASMQSSGLSPTRESSIAKIFHSELTQRIGQTAFEVLGLHASLTPDGQSKWDRRWPINYMTAVPATIAGGANEIQRNVIAQRGLGMPRG